MKSKKVKYTHMVIDIRPGTARQRPARTSFFKSLTQARAFVTEIEKFNEQCMPCLRIVARIFAITAVSK